MVPTYTFIKPKSMDGIIYFTEAFVLYSSQKFLRHGECIKMSMDKNGNLYFRHSVFCVKCNLVKERNKQKHEAMYILKDITADAFKSHKAEVKSVRWKCVALETFL